MIGSATVAGRRSNHPAVQGFQPAAPVNSAAILIAMLHSRRLGLTNPR